jgi:hypothetical protein
MSTAYPSTQEHISSAAEVDTVRIALVIGLGCLLRFVGLGWESLWYDEACSLDMVSASVADIVSGKKLTPGNPFGYFALLRIWCERFGFSIESARALSALFGTLVIPATWLATYRMTADRQVSFWAAFLTAVSPPMIFLSREARVYPVLTLFAVLAMMYASQIIRTNRLRDWVGFVITCAVLPHLHYYSFFFLAVIGTLILWFCRATLWPTLGRLVMAYAAIGLAFLPGLRLFKTQLEIVQEVAVNSLVQGLSFPVYVLGGRSFVWKQDGTALLVIAELLTIFGIWLPVFWQIRKDRQAPWLALAAAAGVFLVAGGVSGFYMSMFNARYVSFILPLLMIVVAYAMVQMVRGKRRGAMIPAVLLGIVTCVSLVRMYAEVQKDDWRSLSQHIATHGPDIPVVFYEDIGALTFKYYRPDQPIVQLFEDFERDGAAWYSAGYANTLNDLPEYWLVISPIWTDEIPQQVTEWCSQGGDLLEQKSFKGLYMARFRSGNGAASDKAVDFSDPDVHPSQNTPEG